VGIDWFSFKILKLASNDFNIRVSFE
jgi:hypothetical protein